jgi:hypothetical protein
MADNNSTAGSTGKSVGKGLNDDPRQANEAGEPGRSGRSRGHQVDKADPTGTSAAGDAKGDAETAPESGRHDAI